MVTRQAPPKANPRHDDSPDQPSDSGQVLWCTFFEQMPAFPGNLSAFIAANLRYPESARQNRLEGRTILQFIIRKNGSLKDPVVARTSGCKDLDTEALRLIRIMPRWIPGKNNGVPVDTWYTLPITFKLD